jgi:hypothetical protein
MRLAGFGDGVLNCRFHGSVRRAGEFNLLGSMLIHWSRLSYALSSEQPLCPTTIVRQH